MTRKVRIATVSTGVAVLVVVAVSFSQEVAPPPRRVEDPQEKAARIELEKQTHRPGPVPDRVILTWKGDPATTQAVTWRTDPTVTEAAAEIALSEGGPRFTQGGKVRRVPAQTQLLKTAINEAHYHSVNFDGLKPKTKYVYRVGGGKSWSEWFQFETASDRPEPFGFIYFGDAQNDIKAHWSRVARGAFSDMPKARFIVHAGDLVDSGPNDAQWGEWHTAAGWINGMVPSVPTPGNHEYSPKLTAHWRAQFTLPENGPPGLEETCYYLDFQGVRIISLNSNERTADQVGWLDRVLANNPSRWTVITFHHPIYSPAKGRDNKALREAWRPVFDRAPKGVDLVLQGHDHTYGRSGLMRDDNTLSGGQVFGEWGTVYAVSVSGPKLYGLGDQPWMARRGEGVQLYQLIRVAGDRLTYEARTATGDQFDAFELRKRPDGGNEIVETKTPDLTETPGESNGRDYWNAAGAVLILALVGLGVGWALRAR
ncbi:MAG: metallophosphoesterase [Gemmataceae bacterium]|nr:metallophosphoesterase [Gemmataceae bacterium]